MKPTDVADHDVPLGALATPRREQNHWESEGVQPLWKSDGWSIHRHNKTSGKSRGGIIAKNLGEYAAKTMVNDANRGSKCFRYKVISPSGEIFHLVVT